MIRNVPVKKAIIIGASSGIGLELSRELSRQNYIIGLVARKAEKLIELGKQLPGKFFIRKIDVTKENAISALLDLIHDMEEVDLIVINSGIAGETEDLDWSLQKKMIETNVLGTSAMINTAYKYFMDKGEGHIAVMSSITAVRGTRFAPVYAASKAFISNYTEGLRHKIKKEKKADITITTIVPGFVQTPLVSGQREGFWYTLADKAARKICRAIRQKREYIIVGGKWKIFALLIKITPRWLYNRI